MSDYDKFTNITRSVSSIEEGAFSESDVEKFLNINSEEEMLEEEDVFPDTSKKIEEFDKSCKYQMEKIMRIFLFMQSVVPFVMIKQKKRRNM